MIQKTFSARTDLAINGAPPAFAEPLHVGRPHIGVRDAFLARIGEMLDNQWLTNNGPLVQQFEQRIAARLGTRHCIAMCNSTIALEIAIRALGLSGEVIVPSWTFVATAHALYWQGITPVFADIDPATHNLDPDAVRRMITPRTTGIIGLHLWGRAAPVEALQDIAEEHGLKLMLDAAHAFGSSYKGQSIGRFGACEVFSFHATKAFNTMEGGAVAERTPFHPRSPYGVAKLYAYWITVNYREAYGLYACNGILFNHESPIRGETFVTRKITRALARIHLGLQECLYLGNLGARRDWGHARDYVEMQWLMLQQPEPEDYVIATGEQHSVREFVEQAAAELGIAIEWRGAGADEHGVVAGAPSDSRLRPGQRIVAIDPRYYRPAEVETLLGDPTKAREQLGWSPRIGFGELVREMMQADLALARRDALIVDAGYPAHSPQD